MDEQRKILIEKLENIKENYKRNIVNYNKSVLEYKSILKELKPYITDTINIKEKILFTKTDIESFLDLITIGNQEKKTRFRVFLYNHTYQPEQSAKEELISTIHETFQKYHMLALNTVRARIHTANELDKIDELLSMIYHIEQITEEQYIMFMVNLETLKVNSEFPYQELILFLKQSIQNEEQKEIDIKEPEEEYEAETPQSGVNIVNNLLENCNTNEELLELDRYIFFYLKEMQPQDFENIIKHQLLEQQEAEELYHSSEPGVDQELAQNYLELAKQKLNAIYMWKQGISIQSEKQESHIDTYVNELYFPKYENGNSPFLSSIKKFDRENLNSIQELLHNFAEGTIDMSNPTKFRYIQNNMLLNQTIELKDFQTRIYLSHISDNRYAVIMGALKKDDNPKHIRNSIYLRLSALDTWINEMKTNFEQSNVLYYTFEEMDQCLTETIEKNRAR